MLDAFKKLHESGMLSEEIKSEIETAFNSKVQENRDQVTAQLREEFARKYEHDKSVMVEAIDRMLSEKLTAELSEFAQDKHAVVEAKIAYHRKMKENAKIMEKFVLKKLGEEIVEFQKDRRKVSENFQKLEQFVINALAKEIKEFSQDKRDLAETKVRLIKEGKAKFEDVKRRFISRSSQLVKEAVTKKLVSEIKQLKEDIDQSRQLAFGRKLFEAFAQEYSNSYLNEKSETAKLLKIIEKKNQEIAEAAQTLSQKEKLVESKEREIRIQKDLTERKSVMGELLSPLSGDKREVMKHLLESVKTPRLRDAFDKYLPAVMEGEKKISNVANEPKLLNEGTVITGDRKMKPEVGLDNILEIRKLAGLKI
jgi:hypothetical protein